MRKRSFEIVRLPELVKTSFLFNNVEVNYAGTNPENGISFYCSLEHNYGVRVYPNGKKVLVCATRNNYGKPYIHSKKEYMKFKHAFGQGKHIFASHAVWMAAGNDDPFGMTIDHIDGCTTNNFIGNLRLLDNATNNRDGGFLTMLCNRGFDPVRIARHILLTYFDRMAVIKPALKRWRYYALNAHDLHATLYLSDKAVMLYFAEKYNLHLQF